MTATRYLIIIQTWNVLHHKDEFFYVLLKNQSSRILLTIGKYDNYGENMSIYSNIYELKSKLYFKVLIPTKTWEISYSSKGRVTSIFKCAVVFVAFVTQEYFFDKITFDDAYTLSSTNWRGEKKKQTVSVIEPDRTDLLMFPRRFFLRRRHEKCFDWRRRQHDLSTATINHNFKLFPCV